MKRIISLLLIAVLCAVLLVSPAAASTDGPSKAEIQEKWQTVTAAETIFETDPSTVSPYAPGALTEDFLESGITYLNFVRYVAGLPEVTLDDTLNTDSQYGAVCLAAIDTLTHYPTQPDDMDDTFFNRAYEATTSANISARWGYARLESLQSAISGCMADNGSLTNLSTVGHRRWLLNPTLGKVGFGYAESSTGWSYIVNHVHDRTGAGCDYDFISWPVSGNHPTNLFDVKNPWSITLNTAKYKTPSADEVKITITRESDGRQWSFDSTTGQPSTHEFPYMIVNTQWYGIPNCIIFHPGSGNVDAYEGIFTVDVTGIYTASGEATSLHYQVDFFDLDACLHEYEAAVTEPTCTERGYTTHTCTLCGDSYVDGYTDALGHAFGPWQETQAPGCESTGIEQRSCTVCGHTESRDVAASGHNYADLVTQPTCTERGYTTHTCTLCGDSYVDGYTDALGHTEVTDVGYAATCTESGLSDGVHCAVCGAVLKEQTVIPATGHSYNAVVTHPTCTEDGYTVYTCALCGDSYTGDHTAATGHSWDEGVVTKEPTVEEEGEVLYTCLSCGITRTETLPAHVHDYAGTEVIDPTCEAEGFTRHICAGCGHTYSDTFVPALGHEWHGLDCLRCGAVRENPFTDTDPLAFYFEPVLWAVENGITTGATATTFDPLGQCQRAQVVTFLWRAAGKPEPVGTNNPFVDVKETDFYYKAVLWAVEKGITNGLDATHFGPFAYCNRAQVVTFLWRSVGRPEAGAANPFTDVVEGAFYYDAVLWAVEKGVTNGLSATEFGINAICNRAQIVTFLYRTFA